MMQSNIGVIGISGEEREEGTEKHIWRNNDQNIFWFDGGEKKLQRSKNLSKPQSEQTKTHRGTLYQIAKTS